MRVVVIPGWFGDHRAFATMFDFLDVERFSYAFIDIRGYGHSRDEAGDYTMAEIAIDEKLNEAYVADGYGNKRVAVLDATTGAFKKYWGAYGNKPEDARVTYRPGEELPKQFPMRRNKALEDDGAQFKKENTRILRCRSAEAS